MVSSITINVVVYPLTILCFKSNLKVFDDAFTMKDIL